MNNKYNNIIKNIRSNILNLTFQAKSSHIGSCLSIVEILVALYFGTLKKTDRFILSKGHACLALYAALNLKGLITDEELLTFEKNCCLTNFFNR